MRMLVALLVLLLAPALASAQAPIPLKAGSGVGPGNPVNDALFDLAKLLFMDRLTTAAQAAK